MSKFCFVTWLFMYVTAAICHIKWPDQITGKYSIDSKLEAINYTRIMDLSDVQKAYDLYIFTCSYFGKWKVGKSEVRYR